MIITIKHLKTAWNIQRINKIKNFGFVICDEFHLRNAKNLALVDACISKNFKETLDYRRSKKDISHIFISEWCKLAIDEYEQVIKLLDPKSVTYIGSETYDRLPIIK